MIMWIILIVVAVIVLYVIIAYNRLVTLKNRIENSWAQIDVQLKRRTDLIPNLIETVKGYMKHEKTVLTEITKARSAMLKASSTEDKARASNMVSDALKSVFAVSEAYPELKANQNFLMLQEELAGTESKIAYARQHYNDSVLSLNTMVESFPSKFIASTFSFAKRHFFEATEVERKNVKVHFE
ncbi:MAG TPA: LemA family protein [Candidatus Nanoarchaeia archaeon]|nr:LemA family protein [Candidatus Nanoarchaeia archaeon]